VLIDYHMPNMGGLSLVQQIRRQRSEDELAIIGVSSAGEKGILARFLKSGANDFLTKPFEIEELYCRIDQNLDMLRYIHEARDAANRDFLTRLYNRRYFFEYAEELHAGALRGELRLMVAMIDADHFKRINDSYGHQMGDAALVEMASVLRTQAGVSGAPARFGGEEFVCIKALDEGQDPAVCLEQLRCAIEAVDLRAANGERIPLTVSIGATTNPRTSIDQMLLVADGAVYLAKKQGRNRVVVLNSLITDESATTRVRRDDR
jgi:diguanylate cyclase (GGDEF)-like protein